MTSIKTFTALAVGTLVIATAGATQAQTPYGQSQPQPYGQSQSSGQEVSGRPGPLGRPAILVGRPYPYRL